VAEIRICKGQKEVKCLVNGSVSLRKLLQLHMPSFSLPCGGGGRCGKCLVRIEGNIPAADETEKSLLSEEQRRMGWRLGCRTVLRADATVFLPESEIITADVPAVAPVSLHNSKDGYGIAVDIGTTTVSAQLYSLHSGRALAREDDRNAQAAFGADVISRMEYCRDHGIDALCDTIRGQINQMIAAMCGKANILLPEITSMVITGNTTMLHLLAGYDPVPMATVPFTPHSLFGAFYTAGDLGLFPENAQIYLPRCISAYVGADITCAALAAGMSDGDMLLDIGTNGEMMLCCGEKLLCCATAAGPAFEGAGISHGMTASRGAISHVFCMDGKLSAQVIGGQKAEGICGSGLLDAAACALQIGIMDETGYLEEDLSVEGVPITQADIRALQLAKAAIAAGVDTLLAAAAMKADDVRKFCLAGGFGSYFDPQSAAAIGLIPAPLAQKAQSLGNAAAAGAAMILLDDAKRLESEKIAERAEEIFLSANDYFKERYIEQMLFALEGEEI